MKYLAWSIVVSLLACRSSAPSSDLNCTGVCLNDQDDVFIAKSYEWNTDDGAVFFNPRGLRKKAVFLVRTVAQNAYLGIGGLRYFNSGYPKAWTAKKASLTYSQAGVLFPMTGINEDGLVVESLVLKSGKYTNYGTDNIDEMQWVGYQLDNYSTVQEVIAHLPSVSIEKDASQLHYFVCDATGECAAIEFDTAGKQVIERFSDKPKILTNHLASEADRHWRREKDKPLPSLKDASTTEGTPSSLDRYRIARDAAAKLSTDSELTVESIIDKVLKPVWIEGYTRWNLVHQPRKFMTTFRTASARNLLRTIDGKKVMQEYGIDCKATPIRFYDMKDAFELPAREGVNGFGVLNASRLLTTDDPASERKMLLRGMELNITPGLLSYYKESKGNSPNTDATTALLMQTFYEATFGKDAPVCDVQ